MPSPPPASPHELRNVLVAFTLLLLVVGGCAAAVAQFNLVCLAVPCDSFLTVHGTVIDLGGEPLDGRTLTIRQQSGANVLPGPDHLEPFDHLVVSSTFEETFQLSPFADRYFLQLVDCPSGGTSVPLPVDLAEIDPYRHDLGRVVVGPP